MRVIATKTLDDVDKDLFGNIQEASRQQHPFDLDPRAIWCELAELRLNMLLIDYKPIGLNRNMNMVALIDRMNAVLDDEEDTAEMFLKEEDILAFRQQQQEIKAGNRPERISFQPRYTLRPSMQCIETKLATWFGMETCEKNESAPPAYNEAAEFALPGYLFPPGAPHETNQTQTNGNAISVTETNTNQKTSGQRKTNQRNGTAKNTKEKNKTEAGPSARKRKGANQDN